MSGINKIKKITVVKQQGVNIFQVGVGGITEILDKSIEYENMLVHIFEIYVEYPIETQRGRVLFAKLVNCPVKIEYDLKY